MTLIILSVIVPELTNSNSNIVFWSFSFLWQTDLVSLLMSLLIVLILIAINLSVNVLYMVLITEAVWIINYILYLLHSLVYNNILILGFLLGFLIFSACEISVGLSIIILSIHGTFTFQLFKL